MTPEHKREIVWTLAMYGLVGLITVLVIVTGMSDLKGV